MLAIGEKVFNVGEVTGVGEFIERDELRRLTTRHEHPDKVSPDESRGAGNEYRSHGQNCLVSEARNPNFEIRNNLQIQNKMEFSKRVVSVISPFGLIQICFVFRASYFEIPAKSYAFAGSSLLAFVCETITHDLR